MRENCADQEPYHQPNWTFVPSADAIRATAVGDRLTVQWRFTANGAVRARCTAADGETWEPAVARGAGGWVSAPRAVPLFARVECTLDGAAAPFRRVADPATRWAADGVTSLGRGDDAALRALEVTEAFDYPPTALVV